MVPRTRPRATVLFLLLAALLIGIAQAALLPPWEGFDETGHYSYIQEVAETGRWPRYGDKMSKVVEDYLVAAPLEPMNGPWSYYRFFASSPDDTKAERDAIQLPPVNPRSWAPGKIANWQSQHPPLYYFALALPYLLSKGWSLAAQLFFLRSLSYLTAWAGLCIVVISISKKRAADPRLAALMPFAIGVWPFILPMWFPEMARLGNDSLITLFAAFTFVLTYRLTSNAGANRDYALLGLTLGLAALTKATALPLVAAVFIYLSILATFEQRSRERLSQRAKGLCICAAMVIGIGGWWYLLKFQETGSLIGSNDVAEMHAAGGLLAGLAKKLSFEAAIRVPWELAMTFHWAGTWSFVLPPRATLLPLLAMSAAIIYGGFRFWARSGIRSIDWFSLLVFGLFIAGLTYHSAALIGLIEHSAPAWYLHSLAPILALLVGCGMAGAASVKWMRGAMIALLIYPLAFLPGVTALNILYFAGCAPKLPERLYFAWSKGVDCLADYPRIHDNLAVLALPDIGLPLFAAGWAAMVVGILMATQTLRTLDVASASSPTPTGDAEDTAS